MGPSLGEAHRIRRLGDVEAGHPAFVDQVQDVRTIPSGDSTVTVLLRVNRLIQKAVALNS